jgi:hypothetical protein
MNSLTSSLRAGQVERIGKVLLGGSLRALLSTSKAQCSTSSDSTVHLHMLLEQERRRATASEIRCKELSRDNEILQKCVAEARGREKQATVKLTHRELEIARLQCELDTVRKSNRRRAIAIDNVTTWLNQQKSSSSALQRLAERRDNVHAERESGAVAQQRSTVRA